MTAATLPPGPRLPRPLQTVGWVLRTGPFLKRCRERYGDTFTLRVAQEFTWVMVSEPDTVEEVFKGDPRLLHAGEANRILLPLVGHNSVLLLDDGQHMRERKLMLPAFHGKRMTRYRDLMREAAERELDRWPLGQAFPLRPRMQAVTLEVIIRAVFGFRDRQRVELARSTRSTS